MLISLDFGIAITDILKKYKNGELEHKMIPSQDDPNERLIRSYFEEVDFNKEVELVALTGGHHQKIKDSNYFSTFKSTEGYEKMIVAKKIILFQNHPLLM